MCVIFDWLFPAIVSLGRGNYPDAAAIAIELVVFHIRRKLEKTKPTRENITIAVLVCYLPENPTYQKTVRVQYATHRKIWQTYNYMRYIFILLRWSTRDSNY